MVKLLYKSYSSSGLCHTTYYKYGQVVAILSLLLSTSTLLLLLITLVDVGKGEELQTGMAMPPNHKLEEEIIKAIKTVTIFYITLQLLMLLIGLRHLLCSSSSSSTFVLTLGVQERHSKTLTRYGATAETESPVAREDITVFYHRVKSVTCPRPCEPLSLPCSGWLLPGQAFCLILSASLFLLHLLLVFKDLFYTTITVVILINLIQQSLQVIFTYINSTDTGFCCLGVSITRWFVHVDFYTKLVQSLVTKKFNSSSNQPIVAEWFRSSLAHQGELDRAGEVRLLQHLLETTHDQLYRQAIPSCDAVSMFMTHREMTDLNQYYIKDSLENKDEQVLFEITSN